MVQLSCSFATNCRTKCYFSRAGQGRQQLIPLNSWVYSLKKKNIWETSMYPKHAFRPRWSLFWRVLAYLEITKAAISRCTWNIVHNLVWDSDPRVRKCQYPPHKNRWHKVRERWICRWQKKSKLVASLPGGKVTVNLNGPRIVAAVLESAMNKEERARSALIWTSVFLTGDLWLTWTLYHMIAKDTQVL